MSGLAVHTSGGPADPFRNLLRSRSVPHRVVRAFPCPAVLFAEPISPPPPVDPQPLVSTCYLRLLFPVHGPKVSARSPRLVHDEQFQQSLSVVRCAPLRPAEAAAQYEPRRGAHAGRGRAALRSSSAGWDREPPDEPWDDEAAAAPARRGARRAEAQRISPPRRTALSRCGGAARRAQPVATRSGSCTTGGPLLIVAAPAPARPAYLRTASSYLLRGARRATPARSWRSPSPTRPRPR